MTVAQVVKKRSEKRVQGARPGGAGGVVRGVGARIGFRSFGGLLICIVLNPLKPILGVLGVVLVVLELVLM